MLTKDKDIIKKTSFLLWEIYHRNIDKYIDLFFYEKEVDLEEKHSETLKESGIIRKGSNGWIANVMAFPFRNKLIITDFLLSIYKEKNGKYTRGLDNVWVMFPHETLLFINRLDNVEGKIALDIASGSGAISLFLTERFEKVISADINPKAVKYARFNAVLNNLEDKIINIQSDLFSELKENRFDYICWNGPTVAMPEVNEPNKVYPLYTYGGFDGAEFTKKFLDEVFNHVRSKFKIKWWDGSLGNSNESVVEQYIKQNFFNLPVKVTIEFLNQRRGVPLREYNRLYNKYCLDKFDLAQRTKGGKKAVNDWQRKLRKQKLFIVYISLITIEPNKRFTVIYKDTSRTFVSPRHVFGFEWHKCSRNFIKTYLKENNH